MSNLENKKAVDHMLAGLGAMIPFVVAGGVLMAMGFSISGVDAMSPVEKGLGTLGQMLYRIGGTHTMAIMFLIVSGFIAQSIAGTPALLPGMVSGSIASANSSSFLGAVIGGFIAGYLVLAIVRYIRLPDSLSGLFNILLLPIGSVLIVGLLSTYVIGVPVAWVMETLTGLLTSLQGGSLMALCGLLGAMMAIDLCGPLLRVAYFFAVAAVIASPGIPQPVMAAVIAAGMTPPLSLALASVLQKYKFTQQERAAGKAAWVLGLSLVCEGMIPFALRDPKRVIPACVAGSALAGCIVAWFGTGTTVVHGGIFILLIGGAVAKPIGFIAAIVAGTLLSTALVLLLKKGLTESAQDLPAE